MDGCACWRGAEHGPWRGVALRQVGMQGALRATHDSSLSRTSTAPSAAPNPCGGGGATHDDAQPVRLVDQRLELLGRAAAAGGLRACAGAWGGGGG